MDGEDEEDVSITWLRRTSTFFDPILNFRDGERGDAIKVQFWADFKGLGTRGGEER